MLYNKFVGAKIRTIFESSKLFAKKVRTAEAIRT